ncbi:MAG: hypothetical protein WBD81_02885 [Collimonas pratensis]|uniref:hypothetical protein n=1 Tax=Collimonas pratensis TaxID=279113 RepID=UPI003C76FA6D
MTTLPITQDTPTNNRLDDQVPYDPNRLLDALIKKFRLKNDGELAQLLEVHPTVISKVRHYRFPIGATLLISMHEVSGLTIAELRALIGGYGKKLATTPPALGEKKIESMKFINA